MGNSHEKVKAPSAADRKVGKKKCRRGGQTGKEVAFCRIFLKKTKREKKKGWGGDPDPKKRANFKKQKKRKKTKKGVGT